jgi:hypothetical protein
VRAASVLVLEFRDGAARQVRDSTRGVPLCRTRAESGRVSTQETFGQITGLDVVPRYEVAKRSQRKL